jgi:hypothetical protein
MDEAEHGRSLFLILIRPAHDNKKTRDLFGWSAGRAVQLQARPMDTLNTALPMVKTMLEQMKEDSILDFNMWHPILQPKF